MELLQPPIPTQNRINLGIDFVEGLKSSHSSIVVWVVVEKLSKYAHDIFLSHLYIAAQ